MSTRRLNAMHYHIRRILWQTLTRSLKDRIIIFGGYAAYTFLLAFFPLVIFLMAAAGLLGSPEASQRLMQFALNYLPGEVTEVVSTVLQSIMENESPELLTLGGLGTMWIASSGVEGLRVGLNRVYAVTEFRPFWKRRLQSIGVVIVGAGAFLLLTFGVIIWPLIAEFAFGFLPLPLEKFMALGCVRWLLAALLLMLLFCALYRLLPHRTHGWYDVWPGAAAAMVLWLALAQLFSLYLTHFGRYDVTYGSIGGVIITLIFFHYSATVILAGAELNAVLEERRGEKQ